MNKLLILLSLALVAGCKSYVPLNQSFLKSESEVGLIVITRPMESTARLSGYKSALIYAAASPWKKYEPAFKVIDPQINPTEKIKKAYQDALEGKGKKVVVISDEDLKKIKVESSSGKHYKTDLSFFKKKYQIEELLIVDVRYGLHSRYFYGGELNRSGKTFLYPTLVNLKDNSILYRQEICPVVPLQGDWNTPPNYDNMKKAINASIDVAVHSAPSCLFIPKK